MRLCLKLLGNMLRCSDKPHSFWKEVLGPFLRGSEHVFGVALVLYSDGRKQCNS